MNMKEITTITTKREHEIKPLRHCELTRAEQREESELVREADKRAEREWNRAPRQFTSDSAETKAWQSKPAWAPDRGMHPLAKAQEEARKAAREDFRMEVARRRAAKTSLRVDLPEHISRVDIKAGIFRDIEAAVEELKQQLRSKYPDVSAGTIDGHIAKCVGAERIALGDLGRWLREARRRIR
jgi:hypothetical protein